MTFQHASLTFRIALSHEFTSPQFIAALVTIPLSTTLAETFSPHTWNSPLIFGVASALLIGIVNHFYEYTEGRYPPFIF